MKVEYELTVGRWSVKSTTDPRTELVALETYVALGSPLAACRIAVYASTPPKGGGLAAAAGQAVGALGLGGSATGGSQFSIDLRGQPITYGDPITLTLTAGDVSEQVVTARVESVRSGFAGTQITGRNALQTLAGTRVDQVYESKTAADIVSDLARQAQVDAGTIETGSRYEYLAVHRARSALGHALEIARRDGMDLYVDTDDHLTMARFAKTTGDHAFEYGAHILDLRRRDHALVSDHVVVAGESPSSSRGTASWPWMLKNGTAARGEVGGGARLRTIADGAVRTKDAADSLAAATLGAMTDAATAGRLRILGFPRVRLGDAIEIRKAPRPELNGTFKVASVRHLFNKRDGFVTIVGFTALGSGGGAGAAGGTLGRAGALAGAAGL